MIVLAAVGLALTYAILRLYHFTHNPFITLSPYLTLLANSFDVNIWVSIISVVVSVVCITFLFKKLF
jgi:branched-subunit amino acid ABC-type transport system permease component